MRNKAEDVSVFVIFFIVLKSEVMDAKLEVTEAQGMFSKRSTSNILSDPRILQHLRIVAQESHRSNISESEETDIDNQRRELYDKITAYNKRNQLGAFKILSREVRLFNNT